MNILFIYSVQESYTPRKPLLNQTSIHYGLSYIASLLKAHGHQIDVLVLTRATKKQVIDQYITQFQPDLIGFTAVTTEYFFIAKIAQYIKNKFPSIYLLIGGNYVSLNPETVIKDAFDALCIGEGEYPTLELVTQLEQEQKPSNIPNLWLKTINGVEKNPNRAFIQDLDQLPFPEREMWQKWLLFPLERPHILIARGCPYNCPYCSNHALRKLSSGKYVRFRSIDNIMQELSDISSSYPNARNIRFLIETLGVNKTFDQALCSALEEFNAQCKVPLEFNAHLRIAPNKNYKPLFHALKKANFNYLSFGLESGSERLRKTILRRNYSNTDFIKVIQLARKYGLKILTLNMIGLPGETLADFKETVELNRTCLPDETQLAIFFPYPGTDLYRTCKEMDILPHNLDSRFERSTPNLDLKDFSKKQILREFQWFWFNIYKGYRPIHQLLIKVLSRKFLSYPSVNNLSRFVSVFLKKTFFKTAIHTL